MKPTLYLCCGKISLFKYLPVRQEIHAGASLLCPAHLRQGTILLQRKSGNASFVIIVINPAIPADLDIQIYRQRIDHRRTHPVKPPAGLISRTVKLSSCMKGGEHQPFCRHSLFMHVHRYSPAVIFHRAGPVPLQYHMDFVTVTCQMLVHCIVHNLIDQMIQTFS